MDRDFLTGGQGVVPAFPGSWPIRLGRVCMTAAAYLLLVIVCAPVAVADVTTRVPDCGYLNARPCHPFDNEAYNIYFGFSTQCDFGLYVNIHNKCVSSSRDTISKQGPNWVTWAMSEQRNNIGAKVPVNYVTTFGTHNSYSSYNSGFNSIFSTDQNLSLYDQLEAGSRIVRIDPYFYFDNMRVCHTSWVPSCAALSPLFSLEFAISPGRLYAYAIRELADWLERHPGELVILLLHNDQFDVSAYGSGSKMGDLLAAPLLEYVGRERIYTPDDKGRTESTTRFPWPTMDELRKDQNKQLLILASRAFRDVNGNPLSFHAGTVTDPDNFTWGVGSNFAATFPNCTDGAAPMWTINSGTRPGLFYTTGEDRSASVTMFPPVEFLNAAEVRSATRCGVSIISVDFLLAQSLSILPAKGPQPDQGEDLRREASIWSFDEKDYGRNGPAIVKANGRWSSDQAPATHHYACVSKIWDWPRRYNTGAGKVKITRGAGWFYGGQFLCESEYGMNFYAPATAQENELLRNEYHTVDWYTGAIYGNGGVWLNYVSTHGNLLALSDSDVSFTLDVPNGTTPAPQTLTIFGPPNSTVAAPALVASGISPILIQNPGAIQFSETGTATITVALAPGGSANLNAGIYNNKLLYVHSDLGNNVQGNNSVISQVILNVNLFARGNTQLVAGGALCQNSVCTATEGKAAELSMVVNRAQASIIPFTGKVELRRLQTSAEGAPGAGRVTTPINPTGFLAPGGGFITASATASVSLPPGSYSLAAYYSGGQIESPVFSTPLTLNVGSFLNPSPTSFSRKLDTSAALPASAGIITVVNPQNRPLTVTTACSAGVTPCWLTGGGAGTQVTLLYAASARNLAPGVYSAQVRISDGLHAAVTVPVELRATGELRLSSAALEFLATTQPVSGTVTGMINGVSVPLEFRVGSGPWIKVDQSLITADPRTLHLGQYIGSVDADSPYAARRVPLPVRLQVVPPAIVGATPDGIPFTVDGAPFTSQQTFAWAPGTRHTISVPVLANTNLGSYLFARWNDAGTVTREVIAPSSAAQSWVATFDLAYPLSALVSPLNGGSIGLTPLPEQGFYRSGARVSVAANPASSHVFTGFRGDLTGLANPQVVTVDRPVSLAAQFAVGAPSLVAIAGAVQRAASPVQVQIQLLNRGTLPATNARIISVSGIRVLAGTGAVTPVTQTVNLGNILPGANARGAISFVWPATATRIQFTVTFGDASGYRGSTTMAVFR
ncbi:MAG: hypothetical protein IPP47_19050 [Bryobacterales bacterium]|nr:hypothetical protein [Bryobacterales bacterium]